MPCELWGKNPGFAVIGIVTLALGMAVNTTIFSVINGILLRPLPVPHAEQLTVLALQDVGDKSLQNFSYPDFLDLRSQTEGFSDLFGYKVSLTGLTADGKGDHCIVGRVTNNYFLALGITPAAGRLLLPSEGLTPGADPVMVLGYSYWQKRFAGDKGVIGKRVEVNGHPITIVGVTPKGFSGTYFILDMDAYVPLSLAVTEELGTPAEDTWMHRDLRSDAHGEAQAGRKLAAGPSFSQRGRPAHRCGASRHRQRHLRASLPGKARPAVSG